MEKLQFQQNLQIEFTKIDFLKKKTFADPWFASGKIEFNDK